MTKHMAVSVRGLKMNIDHAIKNEVFCDDDGIPLTKQEVLKEIIRAEKKGWEVFPTCDDHDEKGYCLGHEE